MPSSYASKVLSKTFFFACLNNRQLTNSMYNHVNLNCNKSIAMRQQSWRRAQAIKYISLYWKRLLDNMFNNRWEVTSEDTTDGVRHWTICRTHNRTMCHHATLNFLEHLLEDLVTCLLSWKATFASLRMGAACTLEHCSPAIFLATTLLFSHNSCFTVQILGTSIPHGSVYFPFMGPDAQFIKGLHLKFSTIQQMTPSIQGSLTYI